ncbi:MAG: hypothetical protein GQ571_13670 [Desulfobacterales bacterium]|nr:hypothetical protein [Desulfobacterales bacterium]
MKDEGRGTMNLSSLVPLLSSAYGQNLRRYSMLLRAMVSGSGSYLKTSTLSHSSQPMSLTASVEQIIQRRLGSKVMGFGAKIIKQKEKNVGETLMMLQPEDLIKYGLIPEFLGRLPVIATLGELNESALIRILKEPKNALVKQFKKLMEMEGVNLRLTDSAFIAIAKEAMKRKSGARGLRAIMEKCMIDIMYEIPSMENVKECVIGEDTVLNQEDPILLLEQPKKQAQDG